MRDLFYNYDHNIMNKDHLIVPAAENNQILANNTCVQKLFNAKGDEIGIKAKQNSVFYLYFNFDTNANIDLYNLLKNNIFFDVIDAQREKVASFDVCLADYASEAYVKVNTSEKGPLSYGVYRMHLYTVIDNQVYTLFSEEDGILSIE